MTDILIRAGSFICMIMTAYLLKKGNLLKKEDFHTLSTLVVKVTLPCAIVTNFSSIEFNPRLLFLAPIGFVSCFFMIGFGYFMARKKGGDEQAFQMINHSGYNVGTFAIPYLQAFVGASGVIYASMFDIGNSILCTGGTYALASSVQDKTKHTSAAELLKKTFSSVPLLTYILMTTLGLLQLHMPKPILTFTGLVANANGFLAMSMLGLGLELSLKKEHFAKISKILIARFGFAAVFSVMAWNLLPVADDIRKTLVLLFFAPLASFDPIFTAKCNGDVGLSSEINSMSILISMVCMTCLFIVL